MDGSLLRETVAMILAGGQGERLSPLTKDRAKPAVPFGGAYRIIDFTLSNCLNSGLRRIFLLTQYRSVSLHRHVQAGWSSFFVPALNQFLDIVPPQQRTHLMWYRGTADAIYQNIYLLDQEKPEYVLILSGDHVYSMDYRAMLDYHCRVGADLTIGCIEVSREEAKRFGVMSVDKDFAIRDFTEKPDDPVPIPGKPDRALASMGIYIFRTAPLVKALIADARQETAHDFGKNIIPNLVHSDAAVYAYPFHEPGRPDRNYWRDIGTLDSFYEANMDLLKPDPPFDLNNEQWPVRTYYFPSPPARVRSADSSTSSVENSLLSPGVVVDGATVRNSILSPNVIVERGACVEDSLIFEGTRIGEGAQVSRAIIDKHVRVPAGDRIGGQPTDESRGFRITERGIVVIPKAMVLA